MSRKRWILIGVFGAALAIALWWYFHDEPLSDHSDLMPAPQNHEISENGYYEFFLATSKAAQVTDEVTRNRWENMLDWAYGTRRSNWIKKLTDSEPWDDAFIETVLPAYDESFEHVTNAVARPAFILPPPPGFDIRPHTEGFGDLKAALILATVRAIRERERERVIELIRVQLELGCRLVEARGSISDLTTAELLIEQALELFGHAIDTWASDGQADTLRQFAGLLDRPFPDSVPPLRRALKFQFVAFSNMVDQVAEGQHELFRNTRLTLRTNMTKNIAAETIRDALDQLSNPPGKRTYAPPVWSGEGNEALEKFGRNGVGYEMLAGLLSSGEAWIDVTVDAEALWGLHRVRIACLLDGFDKGVPTSDLASLGEMPTDPYGGSAFRFDPEAGIIWSIGSDLADEGGARGDPAKRRRSMDDPTVSIFPPQHPPLVAGRGSPREYPSKRRSRRRRARTSQTAPAPIPIDSALTPPPPISPPSTPDASP